MAGRNPVGQRQFLAAVLASIRVDGSEVTTSFSKTGLIKGQHIATVKKGTSSDSNLVTIRLNNPLGMVPSVLIQEETLDCVARVESRGLQEFAIRTLELDGSTVEDDADFEVFLIGTEEIREGQY